MSHQHQPFQSPTNPSSRTSGSYEYTQAGRTSSQLLDDSKMDFSSYASSSGSDFRYASHHRPDTLPSLQPPGGPSSQMSLLSGSNATTPRQSAFARDQVERPPQLSLALPQGMYGSTGSSAAAANAGTTSSSMPMRMSYFDAGGGAMASGEVSGSAFGDPSRSMHLPPTSTGFSSSNTTAAWQQSSLHRTSYNSIGSTSQSGYASSDANGLMLPSATATFAYDSSSENNSPIRPPGYYDGTTGSHFSYANTHPYATPYGSKNAMDQSYGGLHSATVSTGDIDNALAQISALYKSATTKKNAEFYRDKWARIWLSCNYTLKASIQISIPRTILHESYRRACEAFGVEPLQAASFGKVLRGQFPDVAQRRLGGRGKTRFHYCGFGTSNQREAIKVKQLLDDEKAGRLQLSVGMSAEYAQEGRTRSITASGGEDLSRSYGSLDTVADGRQFQFVSPGQYGAHAGAAGSMTTAGSDSQEDKLAASAFANLNGSMVGVQQQGTAAMPRRHTLSSSDANRSNIFGGGSHVLGGANVSGVASFDGAKDGHTLDGSMPGGAGMSSTSEAYSRTGHAGDSSGMHSETNSPSMSMPGQLSRPHSVSQFRRSCRELPDWPVADDNDSTLSVASLNLSMKGKIAWKEYESMCQDLLHAIYHGPDLTSFDRRSTSFWSSLSQDSQEAMRNEPSLSELILRGDAIIVRQLLVRLDDMIGDDVPDERISSLRGVAMSMTSRLQNLLEGRLPASFVKAKVASCEKLTEHLERVASIYEAVRQFRDQSLPDQSPSRRYPDTHTLAPPSFPSTSSSHADILAPSQPYGTSSMKAPFSFQGGQNARRRDDSIGSSVSNSHYTWLSGDQHYSSSASESDFSLQSGATADSAHGGTGSALLGSMAAPVARKWSGHRMRMASGPQTRSTGNSEISGPVSNSLSGIALTGSSGGPGSSSHRGTPSESPRVGGLESIGSSVGAGHSTFATPHPPKSTSASTSASPIVSKDGIGHGSLDMYLQGHGGSEQSGGHPHASSANASAAAGSASSASSVNDANRDQPMDQL